MMYRTIPETSDDEFEHIMDARRSAIRFLERTGGYGPIVIKEKKRGVEGEVVRRREPVTNKFAWIFITSKGYMHIINRDGTLRK